MASSCKLLVGWKWIYAVTFAPGKRNYIPPIKITLWKNVKPARSTLALVSHSFLLAWLKKLYEGQVKILSRNWSCTVIFTLASYSDPSMQSHVLCKGFTPGPASLTLAWPLRWIDRKGSRQGQLLICLAQELPELTQRCLLGAQLPRRSSNEWGWQTPGTQCWVVLWSMRSWPNSEKPTAWLAPLLCNFDTENWNFPTSAKAAKAQDDN